MVRRQVLGGLGLGAGAWLTGCARRLWAPGPPALDLSPPPSAGQAGAAGDEEPVFYLVHLQGRGLPAEVLINDVPVERLSADRVLTATAQVNLWIAPGQNVLRVRGTPDRPVEADTALTVSVRRQPASADGQEGAEVVARIDFAPGDAAEPFDVSRAFVADPAPPSELYRSARSISLDRTRAAALELAHALEYALASGDLDGAARLLDWKAADIARAQYTSPDQARADQREALAALMEDPEFAITPLPVEPTAITLDLLAGGRLVRLSRQGAPAIQAHLSLGGRFALPLYAAQLGERWRIVR